jgi:hypothetical protein
LGTSLAFSKCKDVLVENEVPRRPNMKRSITRWTMAVTAAGVLSLPVSSFARTTQDPQPQQQQPQPQPQPEQQQPTQPQPQPAQPTPTPQQPAPTPQPSASTTQAQGDKALTPEEHLKKAQEAASDINASALPSKNKATLDDMKRHLANLDKSASPGAPTSAEPAKKGAESASKSMNWATEVGAIDKAITEMIGTETSTATTPTPTGTSGKSAAIDDATRAKLMEVRSHITAYAAGMSGTSTPKTEAAASPETPAARPDSSMTAAPTQSPAQAASPAQNPTPSPSPTPAPSPTAAQPDPNAAQPAQPPAGQPSPTNQASAAQAPQTDTAAAHQRLVAARDTLAQLTQLPAAAQLSGEARNQVSQLITNFNELITTESNWHASYDKVSANLTTLLGPDNSDTEAAAGVPATNTGATATPGAVGTSGTASVELDPAIRAKLVELRKNLNEFRKAAGGQ